MAGDGITVTPAELQTHATHVRSVSDQVANARAAGDEVRLDTGAYGQLCAFMPALLGRMQDQILDGLAAACGSLDDTAGRLRKAAGSYDSSDGRAAAAHDTVRDGL